jgi:hypothetical protein
MSSQLFATLRRFWADAGVREAKRMSRTATGQVSLDADCHQTRGKGFTQFGRALYGLNIESWYGNSSQAKGREKRANLTLQNRLIKK